MPLLLKLLLLAVSAAALSYVLCEAWRWLALRFRHLAPPDPLHPSGTAVSGGVGIVAAILVVQLGTGFLPPSGLVLLAAGAFFLLGLIDDLRPLPPRLKFTAQLAIAVALVALGLHADLWTRWFSFGFAVLWLLSVVNGLNLIDNMDGVAAWLAGVGCLALALAAFYLSAPGLAATAAIVGGATLGFLPMNAPPARLFMGDCGSMLLGGFLASATLSLSGPLRQRIVHPLWTMAFFGLLLYVPLVNLLFIVILRKLEGVPIAHGTADHVNYRLLVMGISPRRIGLHVGLLTLAGSVLALAMLRFRPSALPAFAGIVIVCTGYLLLFLSTGDVSALRSSFARKGESAGANGSARLPVKFAYYLADLSFIPLAYYCAFLFRFDGEISAVQMRNFIVTAPFLLLFRFLALQAFGLYRFHWLYAGLDEVMKLAAAIGVSLAALFTTAGFLWVNSFSRGVILIDAVLAFILLGFTRFAMRLLHHLISGESARERPLRVIIIGAGAAGVTLLREARTNRALGFKVIGFVDDDTHKRGVRIDGAPVLGAIADLPHAFRNRAAELAVIAIPSLPAVRREELAQVCIANGIACKVFYLSLTDAEPSIVLTAAATAG